MKKTFLFVISLLLVMAAAGNALATPSNQIWIPSPDAQFFMQWRVDIDNYFRANRNAVGQREYNTLDIGLSLGLLPFERLKLEIGGDFLTTGNDPNDNHPWSGNAKAAVPEGAFFQHSPGLAVGIYNAGPVMREGEAQLVRSGQNIVYGLISKTVPFPDPVSSLGRFSVGYYSGSKRALRPDNNGLLLSWDRTLKGISDRLWLAVDYMAGDNLQGALSLGVAWRFTNAISLLAGYSMYNRGAVAGEDVLITQVDLNFP